MISSVGYYQFDCEQERIKTLNFVEYDKEGKVINSYSEESEWSILIPDSIGESWANFVCKNL